MEGDINIKEVGVMRHLWTRLQYAGRSRSESMRYAPLYVVSAVERYSIGSGMYFRPAAIVSSIPQAVAAGKALSLSMKFLEMVYSFLQISGDRQDVQVTVGQANIE
jgi:hypothetical protein